MKSKGLVDLQCQSEFLDTIQQYDLLESVQVDVSKDLEKCLQNDLTLADLELEVEGHTTPFFACIIWSRCDYLRAKLEFTNNHKLIIDELSSEATQTLLNFLTTDNLSPKPETVVELLEFSHLAVLGRLKAQSEDFLVRNVDSENVGSLLAISLALNLGGLAAHCLTWIQLHYRECMAKGLQNHSSAVKEAIQTFVQFQ